MNDPVPTADEPSEQPEDQSWLEMEVIRGGPPAGGTEHVTRSDE